MATDRLTQLQDLVHNLEELFAVSLDVLRNPARPAAPTGFEGKPGEGGPAVPPPENVGKVFSRLIVQRAKAIDRFIGFLPTAELSESVQREHLAALETSNREARIEFEAAIAEGEDLLRRVREALSGIVSSHYRLVTEGTTVSGAGAAAAAGAKVEVGAGAGSASTVDAMEVEDAGGGAADEEAQPETRGTKRPRAD